MQDYPSIDQLIGNTPLVKLQRLDFGNNTVLLKLEGNNPAGSVKDRAAFSMLRGALDRGEVLSGDHIIEATSGNTGIALAMAAAILGLNMTLIMPQNASRERVIAMRAYGAEVILVEEGMEQARDLALQFEREGKGKILNQFANQDNPQAHIIGTGPEIWRQTGGKVSHFISAMGTTGTIVGCGKYLKAQNPNIQIIGVQPDAHSNIAGIRKWAQEYLPEIYERDNIDQIIHISASEAEAMCRQLAKLEGIFCGVSTGGAVAVALKIAKQLNHQTIVSIAPDRGDRYLSTGVFA